MRRLHGFLGLILLVFSIYLLGTPVVHCDGGVWSSLMGPEGGTISALAVDPQNPQNIYAGTFSGVFKSTNGGQTWINAGLSSMYRIQALTIDPTNPSVLYAGTEGYGGYKSTDAGINWKALDTKGGTWDDSTRAFAIHPVDPKIVYAGTWDGVYRSSDAGLSWTPLKTGISVRGVAVNPTTPAIMYVSAWDKGIYRSTDAGNTWAATIFDLGNLDVNALVIDPKQPSTLYASTPTGIYQSTNGGDKWSNFYVGILTAYGSTGSLAIDPQDSRILYVGAANTETSNQELYKSTDSGATWNTINTGLTYFANNTVNVIAVDPKNSANVYAGFDKGGMAKSANGGAAWSGINSGLRAAVVNTLATDPANSQVIFAGTESDGLFASTTGGQSWKKVSTGATGASVKALAINPSNPQTVYAGYYGEGLYKSTDGGSNWTAINSGLRMPFYTAALAVDPNGSSTIYAGAGTVYKSTDEGGTWNSIYKSSANILAISPDDTSVLYAGTNNGIAKSTDGGTSWKSMSAGLSINALVIDPQSASTLYAGSRDGNDGLLISNDGGRTWSTAKSGLTGRNGIGINSLAVNPDDPSILYAGMESGGVFRSTDYGASWSELNSGLGDLYAINTLIVDPNNPDKVYAAVDAAGVWTYPSSCSSLYMAPGGAVACKTSGDGETTQTGYAKLTTNSSSTPYGTAVISFTLDGVTVSEVGIPSTPPTTKARFFVDYRTGINPIPGRSDSGTVDTNTGVAIVNTGSSKATVTYTLRNFAGTTVAVGHGTVAAGKHYAKFVDQLKDIAPDFDLPSDFQSGSLEIASDQKVSVLALRGTINQEGLFLMTTTPVTDLTKTVLSIPIFFPQYADGGGYSTSFLLLNTTNGVEKGSLQFINKDGTPLSVTPVGGTEDSLFRYTIAPNGAFRFQTDGSPAETKAGWVLLIPDQFTNTPVGAGVFSYNPGNALISESGVPSTLSMTHARVYMDLSGNHNVGLAVANVSTSDSEIVITAYQSDGITPIGTSGDPLQLVPNGYEAKFVDQFISDLPAGFAGVLDIRSTHGFAALTLRSLWNENGDFLMTTFPVAEADQTPPSPVVFPHVVDGGGYHTEFILISNGQASSPNLTSYDEGGLPAASTR
jgi:photosystem II stability/assembly factor-like uncharacterized protein